MGTAVSGVCIRLISWLGGRERRCGHLCVFTIEREERRGGGSGYGGRSES